MHAAHLRALVWLLLIVVCLLAAGHGQEGTPPDQPPAMPPTLPAEDTPTPPATEAPAPEEGSRRVRVSSTRVIISDAEGFVQFIGNVTAESGAILIRAGEATYFTREDRLIARGNVSIRAENGVTYWGNVLEFNARTRAWEFLDWSVAYPPDILGTAFLAPVYVNGEDISSLTGGLRARNAQVTTCDLVPPHYHLISQRIDIFPGDKLIAYKTDVYVLGQKVLHIPWFFLSLKDTRTPFVPEAGQNDYEGYYLRILYQYVFNPEQLGGVRLDLTEKLGTGVGVDHFYTVPNGVGEAFAYGRQGLTEYALRLDHSQQLAPNMVGTVRADVRQNSLFTAQPTTNTDISTNLLRKTTHSNTQFDFTRRLNQGYFSTDNSNTNLRYNLDTTGGTFNFTNTYSRFGRTGAGTTTAPDEEMWNRMQWMRRLSFGRFNLRVDARSDLDGDAYTGDAFFSGLQRLPEAYLEVDNQHVAWDLVRRVPSQFTVGWGRFDERPGDTNLDRYLFDWQLRNVTLPVGKTRLTPTAGVRQTFYGDEDFTAQYSYNAGLSARTEIFSPLSNTLRYTVQQRHGFTPFRFDQVYPYETVTDALDFVTPRFRMNVASGRDLENGRWQDLTMRTEHEILTDLRLTNSTAFDLNNDRWRDLVSQLNWQANPQVNLKIGTRYNLAEGGMRNVSTELGWVLGPWWRLQWLGGYDGIRKELLYNEFLVVRDLHCWDAALYYSYQRKYVYLTLRIKALNVPLPGFGIGRGGQVLDTSSLGVPF